MQVPHRVHVGSANGYSMRIRPPSNTARFVRIILEAVRLAPLLDSVTTSEAVGVGKPNPKIFHAALAAAGCAPEESILVGDSRTRDVAGAKAVGMLALHLQRMGDPDPAAGLSARTLTEAGDILQGMLDG